MPRPFPGSLLLILLLFGIVFTQPAWANGNGVDSTSVTVRVSPLSLLVQNEVTIKVGDFTCQLFHGADPAGVCSDLPPGEYEVSAEAEGYFVIPSGYHLTVPGNAEEADDENGDSADSVNADSEFFFNLYQNNYQMYMPNVQTKP